ncbi:Crp/Fnr family transcriptional regulator [Aquipuribacter sp. MA13-6]|uniref:Crp/Fnr family transcriptional regulator n=1 Tax=unclassified Aquipuribacter TaxID=2635084 RepID=UPI003EF01805
MPQDPFSGLADDERTSVLARMQPRSYRAGSTVFREGDRGDGLHVVEHGHVVVRRTTRDGDLVTLAVLGRGDSFGELSLLVPEATRTADVVALDDVRTRVLHRKDLDRVRTLHPRVDRGLLLVLAAQVQRLSEQVLDALHLPVDERIVATLVRLADLYAEGDGPVVIPIRQEDVAAMAGTSRPTVNRLARRLEGDGILRLGRGRTVVLDRDRLAHA